MKGWGWGGRGEERRGLFDKCAVLVVLRMVLFSVALFSSLLLWDTVQRVVRRRGRRRQFEDLCIKHPFPSAPFNFLRSSRQRLLPSTPSLPVSRSSHRSQLHFIQKNKKSAPSTQTSVPCTSQLHSDKPAFTVFPKREESCFRATVTAPFISSTRACPGTHGSPLHLQKPSLTSQLHSPFTHLGGSFSSAKSATSPASAH